MTAASPKRAGPIAGVGGITIFMVLVVLCFTVFASLALASAQADWRLSEKNAEMVSAYYSADTRGVALVLAIAELWDQGGPPGLIDCEAVLAPLLLDGDELEVTEAGEVLILSAALELDQARILELEVHFYSAQHYVYKSWNLAEKPLEMDFDDTLPVWPGDSKWDDI